MVRGHSLSFLYSFQLRVCITIYLSIVLSVDRHLGSFPFGAITDGAAVKTLVRVSWCSSVCVPVGPMRGTAGSQGLQVLG